MSTPVLLDEPSTAPEDPASVSEVGTVSDVPEAEAELGEDMPDSPLEFPVASPPELPSDSPPPTVGPQPIKRATEAATTLVPRTR